MEEIHTETNEEAVLKRPVFHGAGAILIGYGTTKIPLEGVVAAEGLIQKTFSSNQQNIGAYYSIPLIATLALVWIYSGAKLITEKYR